MRTAIAQPAARARGGADEEDEGDSPTQANSPAPLPSPFGLEKCLPESTSSRKTSTSRLVCESHDHSFCISRPGNSDFQKKSRGNRSVNRHHFWAGSILAGRGRHHTGGSTASCEGARGAPDKVTTHDQGSRLLRLPHSSVHRPPSVPISIEHEKIENDAEATKA